MLVFFSISINILFTNFDFHRGNLDDIRRAFDLLDYENTVNFHESMDYCRDSSSEVNAFDLDVVTFRVDCSTKRDFVADWTANPCQALRNCDGQEMAGYY